MRIWIDLSNSPHVPFFRALAGEFERRGHDILWTLRDYAQTVELANRAGIDAPIFGTHGGGNLLAKFGKFATRIIELSRWARGLGIDLVVVHNSQEPLIVARLLGIASVNLMDYEHHPGNHLSFRTAKLLVLPMAFPEEKAAGFGSSPAKTLRYEGVKEDVYLADLTGDPRFVDELEKLGVTPENVLVVVRPHAPEALYNRGIENDLLDRVIDRAAATENAKVILLPRKTYQGDDLRERHPQANVIIPSVALDGANLLLAADLVISGGGTMNREAAALGVPTATIFTGKAAAIDKYLIAEGRMMRIETPQDVDNLQFTKRRAAEPRRETAALRRVADLILR